MTDSDYEDNIDADPDWKPDDWDSDMFTGDEIEKGW